MTNMQLPETGAVAELMAKVDVLEIALLTALSLQTSEQRKKFAEEFDRNIEAREGISRNVSDPLTWSERLAPHARRLKAALRR